ncbi:WD40-repeat-containing domain protein [Coprinopsis sp. MPI-PUGE-AT-0042]|nr:WD40-repeat-containing domain protein [Coprinopsis sp. MPI-PUGE-AT-0042]
MLSESQQWVLKSKNEVQIISQLSDAAAFADYHCKSEAVQSTPHLYLSSLATFSRSTSSVIVQHWRRQVGGIPGFINAYASGEKALGSSITFSNEVTALTVSQDGANVAVVTGHTDCVRTVAYSLDGTHIVSGSGDTSIRVWSVSGGEQVRVLRGHTHWVLAIASSPDGTNVVSGSWDTSVRVWDLTTGEEVMVLKGHTDWVLAVAYSPGGAYAVSGSADRTLRVWDLTKGDSEEVRVLNGHTDVVNAVAYSPDGTRVVSGSHDRSVRIWDLSMGEEAMILKGHSDSVTAVAYSPDGTRVVSGSRDKSVRVWDVSTGAFLVLKGHSRWVQTVACSPDGVYVVSGSHDESVRVWHLSTGGVVKVFMGHIGRVNSVGYSFDGAHVVSGSDDRSIRVWDALPAHTPRYVRQQGPRGGYTGWLLSPSDPSAYLMFVHPEAFLPDDANVLTFPASAVPQLDFSNAKFGREYSPQAASRGIAKEKRELETKEAAKTKIIELFTNDEVEAVWDDENSIWCCPSCHGEIEETQCMFCGDEFEIEGTNEYSVATISEAEHVDRLPPSHPNASPLPDLTDFLPISRIPESWRTSDADMEEYRQLVARGATPLMISAYSLRFSLQNGIVAHADDALFENFSGPAMKQGPHHDGSEFIEGLLEDVTIVEPNLRCWKTEKVGYGCWETRPSEEFSKAWTETNIDPNEHDEEKEEEGAKGDGGEWDSEGEEDLKYYDTDEDHDEENDEPRDEPEPGADVEAMDEEEAEPVEGNADMIVPDDGEEVWSESTESDGDVAGTDWSEEELSGDDADMLTEETRSFIMSSKFIRP